VFGKNLSTTLHTNNTNTTYIAADCEIVGTLTIKGNARIDGKVEGTVICSGDLGVGSSANLKANIEAKTISIAGQVQGEVKASEFLELSSSAKLFGDIYTKQLKIDQGAVFVGTSHQVYEGRNGLKEPFFEKASGDNAGEDSTKDSEEYGGGKDGSKNAKKDKKK